MPTAISDKFALIDTTSYIMLLFMFNQISCNHKGLDGCINNKIEFEVVQQ